MGELSFFIGSCIPSKYMNQWKPSRSSVHQKSLPYRPNHSSLTIHLGSHRLGPRVIKIIPGLCWIFNGTFVGNLNIHLGCDVDSSCCISFSLTEILATCPLTRILATRPLTWPRSSSFFFIIIIISFFFPSFWNLRPSWSFLTSWIGLPYVKAYGLSLLFREWAFLWNFGPQQSLFWKMLFVLVLTVTSETENAHVANDRNK